MSLDDVRLIDSDNVKKQFYEYLKEELHSKELEIKFFKKDGSLRIMRCTRDFNRIDEEHHPKNTMKENEDSIRVFDLDKNAWRSFRLNSVISFGEVYE
jgi:predicted transcriptional regulator